ncbi:MAG: hypothetical protein Q9227_001507 [Pyrenula ochraceoflavens]
MESADDATSPPSHSNPKKRKAPAARGVASLTPEQLAKKRANDREAQRAIRERTKQQIENLERQILDLTSQQPRQELLAAIREKEAVQAENAEIKKKLASVLAIIQNIVGAQSLKELTSAAVPEDGTKTAQKINQNLTPIPSVHNQAHSEPHSRVLSHPESSTANIGSPSVASGNGARSDSSQPPTIGSFSQPKWEKDKAFDGQRNGLQRDLEFGGTGEKLPLNLLVDNNQQIAKLKGVDKSPPEKRASIGSNTSSRNSSSQPSALQPVQYADCSVPAYAALPRNTGPTCPLDVILLDFLHARQREAAEGAPGQRLVGPAYPSVSSLLNPEKSVYSHPLSKVFTDVLSKFPDISELPEKVAVLYIMFLIMRWEIFPTKENYERLPDWVTPSNTQLFHPHPAWIDYLPWPRMREKMVLNPDYYPFQDWFIPYTTTLSLNWPYEATDTLLAASNNSEELVINPVFERHLRNLENWSLGDAFAKAHPELVETVKIK